MNAEKNIILAIETAVEGGSLAILRGETKIDSWTGNGKVSKAEDVLEQISELLAKNNLTKTDIARVAVSNGPGSSTGIKIGLALAKGLSQSLGVQMMEVSTHEALLGECESNCDGIVITILPLGKNLIGSQIFHNKIPLTMDELSNNKSALTAEEFRNYLEKNDYNQLIFHKNAVERCETLFTDGFFEFSPIISKNNFALLIGKNTL